MTPDEYAAAFHASLEAWDATRPRTLQRAVGVSDVGTCHEALRRKLVGEEPSDAPPFLASLRGTAVDAVFRQARREFGPPGLVLDAEWSGSLPGVEDVMLTGHPDEVDPDEPSVTDYKSRDDRGMAAVIRHGSGDHNRYQRHLYYWLGHVNGVLPAEGVVRNVYVDVTGTYPEPHVEQEPFSMDVVREAAQFLADSKWAADNGEEALRDKHYEWCESYCEYFSACRLGRNYFPDEPVDDPDLVTAAAVFHAEKATEEAARRAKEQARLDLQVLQPRHDKVQAYAMRSGLRVRWTWVNADPGYWRLNVDDPTKGRQR